MTTMRSRVPDTNPPIASELYQFLDALDKRQQRVENITTLESTATLAEVITALNAIINANKTQ
ncbi:hypothetical protein UFOVP1349_51 [uncultured Caudovirales phage]|uniref:Uncharacterized protein n=1 Tax=uncultured Caudovirales phage TaxID=2100421 RepID=A0A6J5PRZ8_9CAUD|nr:hypothetical protein UFOVP925_49 [uncultured Caudovirales phage]CAB4184349.1 hypothetical protein UFOVP1097_57 [uncultured Caudovirales phage]CAB4200537.1 hypothetical protein UFOVP1349_51 [uncultured Caudovirales phage]CAB4214336.1 hypothetical protein UFOVP1456_31 [uncultured Caudovirales phage]